MYKGNRKSSGYRENPSHSLKRVYAQYDDVKVLSELFLSLAFGFLYFLLYFPSLVLFWSSLPYPFTFFAALFPVNLHSFLPTIDTLQSFLPTLSFYPSFYLPSFFPFCLLSLSNPCFLPFIWPFI